MSAHPRQYTKGTVGDSYSEVIPADSDRDNAIRRMVLGVSAHAVLVSFDGGETDNVYVPSGSPITLEGIKIINGSVQVKNATAGEAGTGFYVNVW